MDLVSQETFHQWILHALSFTKDDRMKAAAEIKRYQEGNPNGYVQTTVEYLHSSIPEITVNNKVLAATQLRQSFIETNYSHSILQNLTQQTLQALFPALESLLTDATVSELLYKQVLYIFSSLGAELSKIEGFFTDFAQT